MSTAPLVEPTDLPDVLLLTPVRFDDDRGWFRETYHRAIFDRVLGESVEFVQDNESLSVRGTLRGIHYQIGDAAQGKLVRCLDGHILDVVVDLRRSSATLGSWISVELTADDGRQLWIPAGFGHAFLALEEGTRVAYKATTPYDPAMARTIRWNDPDLAITWPLAHLDPIVSASDAGAPSFAEADLMP